MKILVIDNFDSFVYNIIHALKTFEGIDVTVVKNNKIPFDQINLFDKVVLSPGPGIPEDAGELMKFLSDHSTQIPTLGICLGHQAIAEQFGGSLNNLEKPKHGIASNISISESDYLFEGVEQNPEIGHYHSWVVNVDNAHDLEILASDQDGNIMAIRHKSYDIRGLQFHPESILTPEGIKMLRNWVNH